MKMTGTGEVFLADTAQDIHLIKLENDAITCNGKQVLAFDAGIDWDITKVAGGASAMMAGGLLNMALQGSGWVAIISDGPPVLLTPAMLRRSPTRRPQSPGRAACRRRSRPTSSSRTSSAAAPASRCRWPSRVRAGS
jgi:hypothetical protein